MSPDFSLNDFLNWARTKPAGATYDYVDNGNCAMCQFLRETGRLERPTVGWKTYGEEGSLLPRRPLPNGANDAVSGFGSDWRSLDELWSFGALVQRLEALVPDEPKTDWAAVETYLAVDCGQVPA